MATKTLILPFSHRSVVVKEKVDKPNFWYDDQAKKMWTFHGGRLRFEWNQDIKRMVPRVEWNEDNKRWECKDDFYVSRMKKETNEKDIRKWMKEIGNRIGAEFNKEEKIRNSMSIDIDDDVIPYAKESLERYRIDYEDY